MAETLLGKPASDTPNPKPDEKPAGTPDAKPDEKPAAKPDEKPAEKPDEKPAEKTPEQLAAEKQAADKKIVDDAVAEALKPYAVPEKYTLTIGDDGPFGESDMAELAAEAKALGLTQAQAQKMAEGRAAMVTSTATRYLEELKADPELGGAKLADNVKIALKGRDYLFPPGTAGAEVVNTWFEKTGLGNHKELMRAFIRLGKALAEDSPNLREELGKVPVAERDHASVLYAKKQK